MYDEQRDSLGQSADAQYRNEGSDTSQIATPQEYQHVYDDNGQFQSNVAPADVNMIGNVRRTPNTNTGDYLYNNPSAYMMRPGCGNYGVGGTMNTAHQFDHGGYTPQRHTSPYSESPATHPRSSLNDSPAYYLSPNRGPVLNQRMDGMRNTVVEQQTSIERLTQSNERLNQRVTKLEEDMAKLRQETVTKVEFIDMEGKMKAHSRGIISDNVKDGGEEEGEDAVETMSVKLAGHSKILKLTAETYPRFHGVDQLSQQSDFPIVDWDHFVAEDLPKIAGTETLQVRLRFDLPVHSVHNAPIILMLAKWAKDHGAELDPEYGVYTKDIELVDLHGRFKTKFAALKRASKDTNGSHTNDFTNRAKGVSFSS